MVKKRVIKKLMTQKFVPRLDPILEELEEKEYLKPLEEGERDAFIFLNQNQSFTGEYEKLKQLSDQYILSFSPNKRDGSYSHLNDSKLSRGIEWPQDLTKSVLKLSDPITDSMPSDDIHRVASLLSDVTTCLRGLKNERSFREPVPSVSIV